MKKLLKRHLAVLLIITTILLSNLGQLLLSNDTFQKVEKSNMLEITKKLE